MVWLAAVRTEFQNASNEITFKMHERIARTAVGGVSIFTIQQQAFRNNLVLMRVLFLYLNDTLRKGSKNSDKWVYSTA